MVLIVSEHENKLVQTLSKHIQYAFSSTSTKSNHVWKKIQRSFKNNCNFFKKKYKNFLINPISLYHFKSTPNYDNKM